MYLKIRWRFQFVYIALEQKGQSQHGLQSKTLLAMDFCGDFLFRVLSCIFGDRPENMSYLRDEKEREGRGGRRDRGGALVFLASLDESTVATSQALVFRCVQKELVGGVVNLFPMYTPRPRARMCESSRDGMNTLRNSAEKMPPFFMAPVFLMLKVTERRG